MTHGYLSEIFVSYQGEGAEVGRRQLFVRLSGCNLRCRYCDTPDSLERGTRFRVHDRVDPSEGSNPLTSAQALGLMLRVLEGQPHVDGVSVTGGEPLLQADFIAELLADARMPRPRLLETNGMLPDRLATVLPVIDVISMDIKLPSNTGEPAFWDAHTRFLSLARGKIYVKVLVDPATDPGDIDRAAALVQATAPETPVFLQPITAPDHTVHLDAMALNRFFGAFRSRLADVRVLPQTHKMIGVR